MPLYRKFEAGHSTIAIWKIEEDMAFFQTWFADGPEILNENKRLQWFATRYLISNILGIEAVMGKDEAGKPVLENSDGHLSISHTQAFAAVMINASSSVGIDIEMITPKVVRIAHKFLREDELHAINPDEKIEKLILYWSAKEALYKLHGKGGIEFKNQLLIKPFELKKKGELRAKIVAPDITLNPLIVHYEFFDGHVLSYVAGLEKWDADLL